MSIDLSTSYAALNPPEEMDDFTKGMIAAVNGMLLDILAVVARKDYEDRRRRQAEGNAKGKADGAYKGRPVDAKLRERIGELLSDGKSIRKVASLLECSTTTVQKVKTAQQQKAYDEAHEAFEKVDNRWNGRLIKAVSLEHLGPPLLIGACGRTRETQCIVPEKRLKSNPQALLTDDIAPGCWRSLCYRDFRPPTGGFFMPLIFADFSR